MKRQYSAIAELLAFTCDDVNRCTGKIKGLSQLVNQESLVREVQQVGIINKTTKVGGLTATWVM